MKLVVDNTRPPTSIEVKDCFNGMTDKQRLLAILAKRMDYLSEKLAQAEYVREIASVETRMDELDRIIEIVRERL